MTNIKISVGDIVMVCDKRNIGNSVGGLVKGTVVAHVDGTDFLVLDSSGFIHKVPAYEIVPMEGDANA